MKRPFVVSGASVSHDRASVDHLEAACHPDPGARTRALLERDGVGEAMVLQTCNRIEEYVVTGTVDEGTEALVDVGDGIPEACVERMGHEASLRHLLRVAAGLESQLLGEDEILGQLREAYADARAVGGIGPVLEAGVLKAVHVGERARTETGVNDGIVSLGSAAVELADRETGLETAAVLVVGAGAMARTVLAALADRGVGEVRLVNRSVERARRLVDEVGVAATCAGMDGLEAGLAAADVVFTSTASPEPVIDAEVAAGLGGAVVVDIAHPRDVDRGVEAATDAKVLDLDDLKAVTERTHEDRREAAREVEAIIDEELDLLLDGYKRRRADAVIRAMYQGADRIKDEQLSRALDSLDARGGLTEAQEDVVVDLADALVSQLLAIPTESLREAAAEDDWETISTALELFDPSVDADTTALFAELAGRVEADGRDTD